MLHFQLLGVIEFIANSYKFIFICFLHKKTNHLYLTYASQIQIKTIPQVTSRDKSIIILTAQDVFFR